MFARRINICRERDDGDDTLIVNLQILARSFPSRLRKYLARMSMCISFHATFSLTTRYRGARVFSRARNSDSRCFRTRTAYTGINFRINILISTGRSSLANAIRPSLLITVPAHCAFDCSLNCDFANLGNDG